MCRFLNEKKRMPETKLMFDFLRQLAENNNREWFGSQQQEYQKAKNAAENLIGHCISSLSESYPLGELLPKQCMFRIFRDVRFSRNKDPYKKNFSALIAPGGRKSPSVFSWYLHLEPGNFFLASGMYEPSPEQLARIRQEIEYNAAEFRGILSELAGCFGELQGNQLKTAPKSYPKDHPEIAFLRHVQWYFMKSYSESEISSPDFPQRFSDDALRLLPFLRFLERALA
jgi:uncharacterized protein (TIGR02453 family)